MSVNVCIASGSRADYGLLRGVIREMNASKDFALHLFVTGSHLNTNFGMTYKEIENDGIPIAKKINIAIDGDQPTDIARSFGLGVTGFSKAFDSIKPDLLILLGDRYEIFSVAIAAMLHSIPIAHIHGGEVTAGAMDEGIRHSITKLSHFHFVANEEYARRVVQLGEDPKNVVCSGGLGVDAIEQVKLTPKKDLEKKLGLKFKERNLLITYHPVTLEQGAATREFNELIRAVGDLEETRLIFTLPNADTNHQIIFDSIKSFSINREHVSVFESLGQTNYYSLIPHVDAVVGNSSSGLLEVPTFKKATINIGSRQDGRLKACSVVDCRLCFSEIKKAIEYSYSDDFQKILAGVKNPYGNPGASKLIVDHIRTLDLKNVLKKVFYDM